MNFVKGSILSLILFTGCISYRVPNLTSTHPACPATTTCDIEFSPILEIDCETIPIIPSTAIHNE